MRDQRNVLEEWIARAVRAEVGRAVDRASEPVRAKVEEVAIDAVRRAAAASSAEAGIDRLVGVAARRAVDRLLDVIRPGKGRP
jgi:hypothetical protein